MQMIQKFNNGFMNIIKQIYKISYDFSGELHSLHTTLNSPRYTEKHREEILKIKLLGIDDRESIFYDSYHTFIDNNRIFNDTYFQFVKEHMKPLFSDGGPIVVQKTPNIRISFPNSTAIGRNEHEKEEDKIIGIHKDADFGHNSNEINIIIPVTKMFDTNSIYYEPEPYSNLQMDDYINLKLDTDEFFVGKFNTLLHYNRINKTGFTRISLDLRIIRYEEYIRDLESFKNTKFELGKYYIVV